MACPQIAWKWSCIVRRESVRSVRRCIVWDRVEVQSLCFTHHYFLTFVTNVALSYFPMVLCVLVQSLCYLSAFVDEWESTAVDVIVLHSLCSTLANLLFQAIDASLEGKVQDVPGGVQFEIMSKCRHFVSLATTFWPSSPMYSVYLTSRWCSLSLFNVFVTCPRCSLINENVLYVIVLYFLCSNFSTSCFKQLTRNVILHTSHVLAVFSSSLKLQTIKLSTAHIMVDLY